MPGKYLFSAVLAPLRGGWLGPHFQYDIVRLARKGWPTLARVLFLTVVLVSMLLMDRTQGQSVHFSQPAEFARRASNFAYLLIILQDLLILALLPVYVASAIAEEKENQTLESLTLTHLTDRELVLGKFAARLVHVGAFALATFPLLAFMHLWGNVDASLLVYHEINLFLMLISAGSVCIWVSARSDSVFNAISSSYGWMALLGFFCIVAALALPWFGEAANRAAGGLGPVDGPLYFSSLIPLVLLHAGLTVVALRSAIARMEFLRREERKQTRKATGSLALTDNRPISKRTGKRGQAQSRIHPWAWPVTGNALFWKECLKDGSTHSLSVRWLLYGVGFVAAVSASYHLINLFPLDDIRRNNMRGLAYTLTFTTYLIALAAYFLVTVFQMTMTVAGEREHGTLTFLLSIPDDRRAILFAKWLGPWWRNWPILAVSYLGAAVGFGCGIYDWKAFLLLIVLPWPLLLMLGCLGLWLSVLCRRVLFANVAVVAFVGLVAIAHVAAGEPAWIALAYYFSLVGEGAPMSRFEGYSPMLAPSMALTQQTIFLSVAGLCTAHSFWVFGRKDYCAN